MSSFRTEHTTRQDNSIVRPGRNVVVKFNVVFLLDTADIWPKDRKTVSWKIILTERMVDVITRIANVWTVLLEGESEWGYATATPWIPFFSIRRITRSAHIHPFRRSRRPARITSDDNRDVRHTEPDNRDRRRCKWPPTNPGLNGRKFHLVEAA